MNPAVWLQNYETTTVIYCRMREWGPGGGAFPHEQAGTCEQRHGEDKGVMHVNIWRKGTGAARFFRKWARFF